MDAYEKALQIDPKSTAAWIGKGDALRAMGRYDEAVTAYDKALEYSPKSYAVWASKAASLRSLGKYKNHGCM
jgi:tetratricopeptide (TPR) repeat protein